MTWTDAVIVEGIAPMPIHNKINTNILRQIFLIDTVCASWKDIERERERGEVVRFVNGQVFDDNNNFGVILSSTISNKIDF